MKEEIIKDEYYIFDLLKSYEITEDPKKQIDLFMEIIDCVTDLDLIKQNFILKTVAIKTKIPVSELKNFIQEKRSEKGISIIADQEKCKEIRTTFIEFLQEKKPHEATETIVKYIEDKDYIYTTKDDVKTEMWIYHKGIYIPNGKSVVKQKVREILGSWYNQYFMNQVLAKIEADTFIDTEEFFKNNNIKEIPVLNGILNLETRELTPFNPKKIFFNKINANFDKDAICPKIDKFLSEVLAKPEDRAVFYELGGFSLWKEYKYEKAFMFFGNGRNGKDKSLELLKRLIGIENCCSVPLSSLLPDSFIISEFVGKMVNLSGEINNKDLKDTSSFKALTGRSLQTADRKFLKPITFVNYAKFVFACNDLPMVYDNSRGFWDRWILLEFPFTFVTKEEYDAKHKENPLLRIKDDDIIEKITTKEEFSGLLNQFLDGWNRLKENKRFSLTQGTEEIKSLWVGKSNSVMAFCLNKLEEQYNQVITRQEFQQEYIKYCETNKLKIESVKKIKKTMEELYGLVDDSKKIHGITYRVWSGLKFKD